MTRLMEKKFRIVVLIITTLCLSMMLANILALNFTMLCITEEKYRWESFTINLGMEVFEKVDFQTKQTSKIDNNIPEISPHDQTPSIPGFPEVEIPGIRIPSPGFNWQSFNLARQNPQLFLRLLKTIIYEASKHGAKRIGEKFDPRNIDFQKFQNGFNLTDLNKDVIIRVKKYILNRINLMENAYDVIDAEGRYVNQWRNTDVNNIHLTNITWNGIIKGNIRVIERPADHYYTPNEKAWLFSVVAIGALAAIYFVSNSICRFGCRKTFTVVGIISAFSTALCPAAASAGFFALVFVRIIQGIGFAACMPVIGAVTSSWAKLSENGLFNGVLTCFIQIGPVIAMPLSGIFCSTSLRWPAVFYFQGILTILLISAWWLIYRDLPSESKHVLNVELRKIELGKGIDGYQKYNRTLPVRAICTNLTAWAVWIATIGNMFAIQTIIFFAPRFINKVLLYPIINVGFAAAFPTFLQLFVKIFAGISSDKIKRFNETQKVKIFNTIAFCGMAFFFIILALCPVPGPRNSLILENEEISCWRFFALICLIMTVGILGFNTGGFFKSATLIGREYAYFINTNVQIIMCIAILIIPFFVFTLTPNNEPWGWSFVFLLLALLLIICNGIFCVYGSGNAATFTKVSITNNTSLEQIKPIIKSKLENNDTQPDKA